MVALVAATCASGLARVVVWAKSQARNACSFASAAHDQGGGQAYPSGIRQFKGSSAYSAITNGNLVVAAGVSGVAKDKDDYLI